jgi:hypothetical protein
MRAYRRGRNARDPFLARGEVGLVVVVEGLLAGLVDLLGDFHALLVARHAGAGGDEPAHDDVPIEASAPLFAAA